MVKRVWYSTPAREAMRRIDGPYESRDDCELACLKRTDRDTAARMLARGVMPAYFIPRMFEIRDTEQMFSASVMEGPPARLRASRPDVHLPDVVYGYTRSNLLVLVAALGFEAPVGAAGLDRAAILGYIEKSLSDLMTGRKVVF